MRIVEFSIENFKSIYLLPPTKLQKVNIFIGKNNAGKSAIMDALFIALGNITNSTAISENITSEQLDKLWFFGNYQKPATIKIKIELDKNQENILKEVSGLEEVKYAYLEVALSRKETHVGWQLLTLNLLGPSLKSMEEKLNKVYKAKVGKELKQHAQSKIVENAKILNEELFLRFVQAVKDKVFRLVPYLDLKGEDSERIRGLNRFLGVPPSMREYLEQVARDNVYRRELIKWAKEINPEYASYPETGELTKYYRDTSFRAECFGSGEQLIDGLLATILGIYYKYGECIVMIEEPEIHLHPDYIRRLAYVIKNIAEEKNMQILVVTHSPDFIKMIDWDSVFVVSLMGVSEGIFEGEPTTVIKKLGKNREDAEKLAFDLGISVGEIPFIDFLILVEGETDKRIMEKSIQILRNEGYLQRHLKNINFYAYKFYKIAELETKVKAPIKIAKEIYGSKVFVIADGDEGGEKICKDAEEYGLKKNKNIFQWSEPDILCLCDKTLVINAIENVVEKYKKEMPNNKLKERVNKLLRESRNESIENIFKKNGILEKVASIIRDNNNELKSYYDKKQFYHKLKVEVGEIVVERMEKVPHEIKEVLLRINETLGGEYL